MKSNSNDIDNQDFKELIKDLFDMNDDINDDYSIYL